MFEPTKTVREYALEIPAATRIFEKLGIDYCCGGSKSLADACANAGVAEHTRMTNDRENTCAEQVFSRYEPSGPSVKLISILQYWEDTKDGTHFRQPSPNHFSNQDPG
jgi:iron-sulfur cluster repair protein YtfE (RIC family)